MGCHGSGTYFYTLTAGGFKETRKLVRLEHCAWPADCPGGEPVIGSFPDLVCDARTKARVNEHRRFEYSPGYCSQSHFGAGAWK